jgi:hypothetical protein
MGSRRAQSGQVPCSGAGRRDKVLDEVSAGNKRLDGYFFNNFRPNLARVKRPTPSKSMLEGSGTKRMTIVHSLFE